VVAHTLGVPHLYTGRVYFTVHTGADEPNDDDDDAVVESDRDEWRIGIRTTTTSICPYSGGRVFSINRHRVFLQGGNWIATDAMLQRGTRERYRSEVLLHQFAGLNLIRVWGGGLTERPEFYDACDELGILVLQEFWMSGDNNGRWAGSYDWPLDHDSYLEQARDMVLMIRRHPSLLFWCAGNELWPVAVSPPPKIQVGLRKIIADVDKDRFLIMSSMDGGFTGGNMSEHIDTYALSVEDGPYDMLTPITYFAEKNPGMKNGTTAVAAFQPEVGSSGMPRFHTLQRMGLAENETDFPNESLKYVPTLWKYHNYQGFVLRDVANNNTLSDGIVAYGEPHSIQDYVARAQLVCLQQYQSLFEGFSSKMFDRKEAGGKTAVIMWKTQSPWPSLRGFLYDWWLDGTGSLDGVRAGTGGRNKSLKLQLNLATMCVEIVNRGRQTYSETSNVTVAWYALNGTNVLLQNGILVDPASVNGVARSHYPVQIPNSDEPGKVFFAQVSSNPDLDSSWYWMAFNSTGDGFSYDYAELGAWRDNGPFPKVSGFLHNVTLDDTGFWWEATLVVTVDPLGGSLAFAPSFSAQDSNGKHLLPLFADSPTVLIGATTIPLRVKLQEKRACVKKISCDFWAGGSLEILIDELVCGMWSAES
jgi:mannosylglycoprotein endo-beta-mannosidase